MSDQPEQHESNKKPVRVAIVGHVGYSRSSVMAAMVAALTASNEAAAKSGDGQRVVLVDEFDAVGKMDWSKLEAVAAMECPVATHRDRFCGDRTYESPFTRRSRLRRR